MHSDLDKPSLDFAARLRQLPVEMDPPYHWQEFRRRRDHARSRWSPSKPQVAAAAAVIVLMLGAVAGWLGQSRSNSASGTMTSVSNADLRAAAQVDTPVALNKVDEWRPTVSQSRQIEGWLASLPQDPALVRVGTRAAVAGLEDQIARVDDMLTAARLQGDPGTQLAMLQRERAQLLGSLAQVRYAEVLATTSP